MNHAEITNSPTSGLWGRVRYLKASGTALVAVVLLTLAASPAQAATGRVATTNGTPLNVRSAPSGGAVIRTVPMGANVSFSCYELGDWVTGPWGRSNIWNKLDDGGFVADAWIYTGSNNPVVPRCSAAPPPPAPPPPAPTPQPAPAKGTGKVITTNGTQLAIRSNATGGAPIGYLPMGATVTFSCYVRGMSVTGPYGASTIWDRLDNGGFVSDAWIYTGSNNPVVPECSSSTPAPPPVPPRVNFNREAAAKWTLANARAPQRAEGLCTYLASRALTAGGLPSTTTWREGSHAWIYADNLRNYLRDNQIATVTEVTSRYQKGQSHTLPSAQKGDIIFYDWDGNGGLDHAAVVVAVQPNGYPEVSEWGTVDFANFAQKKLGVRVSYVQRGWTWSVKQNGWLTDHNPGMKAYLAHINT